MRNPWREFSKLSPHPKVMTTRIPHSTVRTPHQRNPKSDIPNPKSQKRSVDADVDRINRVVSGDDQLAVAGEAETYNTVSGYK